MTKVEFFVGGLAMFIASIAVAIALGPWKSPYRIGSVAYVQSRFGKPSARLLWLAVAVIAASSGVAIFSGFRPGYVAPIEHGERPH